MNGIEDLPGIDPSKAHVARMYDYYLGRENNFEADRMACVELDSVIAGIRGMAINNRRYLVRLVRTLAADYGIRQFLDIGSGLPTQENVHQIARKAVPDTRVVYVEVDPIVAVHGRALIADDASTAFILEDARNTGAILDHPETRRLIDFTEPVAVLFITLLHQIPDQDDPIGLVQRLMAPSVPGSFLAISHPVAADPELRSRITDIALAACRRLRGTLDSELGVQPGPELRDLELAVLRRSGDLELCGRVKAGAARRSRALPAHISSFVGRDRELRELARLLGAHRLVMLTGTGGSGKTRLALEAAAHIAASGRTDALLVDLTSVTKASPFEDTLADAVGVRAEPGRPLAATIAGALSGRETMIVLDNCEHLLDECAAFAQAVLAASTAMRLLATSREPLGIPGEVVYPVRPLQLAAGDEGWDQIATCEAVRLFTSRASAARPGFAVTADDAQLVLAICRRVDGLPLAIELAAARAASMSLRDLAALLGDRFRLLDSAVRTADARHRSLATTMAWSYDLLTEAERALFVRVGVFPASFDLHAATAVAGGTELFGHDVLSLLSRLVVCSTVAFEEGAGAGARYRLLETARQFARRYLTGPQLAGLRERHARHYLALVQEAGRHLFRAGSAAWLGRLHNESDNLRAALEWSFGPAGDPQTGAGLVTGLWHYWDLRGARGEGLHWVHAGLEAVGADRPEDRMPLLSAGALLHLGRADFEATQALAREQLTLARAAQNQPWEGNALAMLATTAWARGPFDRAQQLYEDAITASIKGGDLWRAALEEAQLARLHRDRNEPDAAKTAASRSLGHAIEVGEELARGLAVDVLASLEHRWGDASEARALAGEALEHYRLVGYEEGEASALHLTGRIALAAHETESATAAFERALQLCRRIGHRAGEAAALHGLAAAAAAAADIETATRLASDAATLRAEIGIPLPAELPERRSFAG